MKAGKGRPVGVELNRFCGGGRAAGAGGALGTLAGCWYRYWMYEPECGRKVCLRKGVCAEATHLGRLTGCR